MGDGGQSPYGHVNDVHRQGAKDAKDGALQVNANVNVVSFPPRSPLVRLALLALLAVAVFAVWVHRTGKGPPPIYIPVEGVMAEGRADSSRSACPDGRGTAG